MTKVRLHLDSDASIRTLYSVLLQRGLDVTRTPNSWMLADASDEQQLLGATAQGRVIFTFNVRDFMVLAERYQAHAGILLAAQAMWSLTALISALQRVLEETEAEEWRGQVRWLSDWR
jgi:hypothetical protein